MDRSQYIPRESNLIGLNIAEIEDISSYGSIKSFLLGRYTFLVNFYKIVVKFIRSFFKELNEFIPNFLIIIFFNRGITLFIHLLVSLMRNACLKISLNDFLMGILIDRVRKSIILNEWV